MFAKYIFGMDTGSRKTEAAKPAIGWGRVGVESSYERSELETRDQFPVATQNKRTEKSLRCKDFSVLK